MTSSTVLVRAHRLGQGAVLAFCIAAFSLVVLPLNLLALERGDVFADALHPGTPVKREILALYDSTEEREPAATRIHRYAEMPLNHLGFIVRFHDLASGLPDPAQANRYAGMLTWFAGPIPDQRGYLKWATDAVRRGTRLVILGHVGVAPAPEMLPMLNRLLATIGLRQTGEIVETTLGGRITSSDAELMSFERPPDPVMPPFSVTVPVTDEVRVALEVEQQTARGQVRSVVVAVGTGGGYAALGYEFFHEKPPLGRGKWIVNPFEFFRRALGSPSFPCPDTTTMSGRRLYFSLIDGDGWTRPTRIERYTARPTTNADVILKELIEPFPDLPVTVALGDDDFDPLARPTTEQILSSAWVELASRGHIVAPPSAEITSSGDESRKPGVPSGPETVRISADARPPGLYLASGPVGSLESARALREANLTIMLPSNSRYDLEYPSVAYVAPLSNAVGDNFGLYSPDAADLAYSSAGSNFPNAFRALSHTLKNTETPRRLKSFNLFYHAGSVELSAALQAVKLHLADARASSLAPITGSHYASIAAGFFTTRISEIEPQTWSISERSSLQTVRFDDADRVEVNIGSSSGVIGYTRYAGSLYVALDETVENAIVKLTKREAADRAAAVPYLVDTRWLVAGLDRAPCGISFRAQGFGAGEFAWLGFTPGRYTVSILRHGETLWTTAETVSTDGRLTFTAPVNAIDPVDFKIACAEQG